MLCVRVLHVMCLTCYMCHLTCYVCPAAWALLLLRAPRAPPVPHAAHCPMCVCHICVLSYLCLIRACPTLPRASRLSPCRRPSPTLSPTDPGPTARLALAPWRHCVSPSCSLPACRPWRASACVSYTDRGKTKTDALYVCLICVPYMCALNVCLICVPDMCALCELDTDGARPRQTVGGGLNGRPEKLPDVCYSWWILSALAIMRRLHWIDRLCPSAACAPLLPEPRCPLPPAGCYTALPATPLCPSPRHTPRASRLRPRVQRQFCPSIFLCFLFFFFLWPGLGPTCMQVGSRARSLPAHAQRKAPACRAVSTSRAPPAESDARVCLVYLSCV